ncbi:MAG: hypothetical protein R3325_03320 [Thermoanaerobaculia bacterium]|nr:hypothetical protein [Thermoanaerobaculia bacterium]
MNAWRPALTLVKILGLAVALMVSSGIGSTLLPASATAPTGEEGAAGAPSGGFLALVAALMLAQTIALALPVLAARWHGWRLVGAVFLLHFGTVTFLSQVETLVYLGDRLGGEMVGGLFLMGLFTAALFAPLPVLVLGRWRPSPEAPDRPPATSLDGWPWKSAVGGLLFVALYYLFGYYVAWRTPEVREFYGGTDPGSFLAQMASVMEGTPWMLPFQLARGLLWVALAVLAMRMMRGPLWRVALSVSILFGVPALYLLLPNPLMPDPVRMAHLLETAPCQFLFGALVVFLFRRRTAGSIGDG